MVYFHKEQLTEFTYADGERCTLIGYPGNVYKIEDNIYSEYIDEDCPD